MSASPKKWLCIDPGETTGWSIWQGKKLLEAGQTDMWGFIDDVDQSIAASDDVMYMAGLLDGEGHISIQNKKHPCGRIQINMTVSAPLEWCAATFGGNFNGPYDKGANNLPVYTWSTAQADTVARILSFVLPHLKVKQQDAAEVLDFLEDKNVDLPIFAGVSALVVEDWKLYPWMLDKLAWDACRTARAIGALELIARQNGIPIILQGADIKDAAQAAGAEELYVSPVYENRHANDSIQHGVFYLARHGKAPC
jgi:hypothetical protein